MAGVEQNAERKSVEKVDTNYNLNYGEMAQNLPLETNDSKVVNGAIIIEPYQNNGGIRTRIIKGTN